MATTAERRSIATALWDARRDRITIAPPSTRVANFDLEDGYAVGAELHALRIGGGERRAGLKVGFTNAAIWEKVGLAEPICAVVYDRSVRHVGMNERDTVVDLEPFVAPAIEPEIVIGIGEHGPAWWALGFEIVHCHYPNWQMTPAEALADGALHGALVVGTRIALSSAAEELRTPFTVELFRNGAGFESATTAAVLGGPLHALDRASQICARASVLSPPAPGEVVTTGSLTSAPRIVAGETWTLRANIETPPLQIILK
ncbi:MAG: hypothetical protein IAI50_09100 [Candidatus Eremiobacteraeota bacterium]|nr:hypothetical protein [Candidatus Eremiobacteraeota bacterium]